MHPVLFQIGGLTISSYGAMAALGFVIGCIFLTLNHKYAKMSSDQASTSLFIAMVAGLVGARIFYVVQYFDNYQDNLWSVFRIDQGGLVFYGGFLLALLALYLYSRYNKLDFIRMLDVYAPAMALAHAAGRIGCFLNGCCYGKPTDSFLGVVYPPGTHPTERFPGMALHPVQLYEAGGQILLFFLYLYLMRHAKRGVAASSYLALYGVFRFVNELLRGDNDRVFNLFTPAQLIGLALIPAGVIMLIYFQRQNEQNTSLPD